ncbi:PhoH family protein [Intestinibacillus massiliensis]|uniref:PhoH family protein n=1 Tax=Intestinibacillus massiliensis TaxID=1871029 RepID=UPI001D080FAD|nr:PhoH family protein [Intestinibacillus massiliensis]MCB6366226.1 PhoH family protein [Intestinibacillus massiliensis]
MQKHIAFDGVSQQAVFGAFDSNLRAVEKALAVSIVSRDDGVDISGDTEEAVCQAVHTLEALRAIHQNGEPVNDITVSSVLDSVRTGDVSSAVAASKDTVAISYRGQPIKCRTAGQKRFIETIKKNTITLCIGPAGTGKTFLAAAMAVTAFRGKEVDRIVLTRPAVEAGEKLGFLPGDLQSKVDPYLRPLYDALYDMLGTDKVKDYMEKGAIEIAPLAYMRGRTLNNSYVLIDEAQNITLSSLKMALTRLGAGSKMILTGDVTQIDLQDGQESGLAKCAQMLADIEGIGVVHLHNADVVRHRLVQEIVRAFEKEENAAKKGKGAPRPYQKPFYR